MCGLMYNSEELSQLGEKVLNIAWFLRAFYIVSHLSLKTFLHYICVERLCVLACIDNYSREKDDGCVRVRSVFMSVKRVSSANLSTKCHVFYLTWKKECILH